MIHELLHLTRPLIVFDTETTGTDVKQDRIIEIGFQLWTSEGLQKEYRTRINPGVPIPPASTVVHGITDADMKLCQNCKQDEGWHGDPGGPDACQFRRVPTFAQLAPNLLIGFGNCDYAGKNVRFDLRILSSEMARTGHQWSYAGARVIDIDRLEALLNKRSLGHLYRKYTGRKLEGAHGALTDVIASTMVLEAQMVAETQNEDDARQLPRDLDALHALQWPGWIDGDGLFIFVDGVACFGRWGKHAGRPMKDVPSDYYDFILKNDFSTEAKVIAGRAKLRQFPEVQR